MTDELILRSATVLVAVVCLVWIALRQPWRRMSRGQLLHWQAVVLLVFGAAFRSGEAAVLRLPGGIGLLVVFVAVAYLLASLVLRDKDARDPGESEK